MCLVIRLCCWIETINWLKSSTCISSPLGVGMLLELLGKSQFPTGTGSVSWYHGVMVCRFP